MGSDAHPRLRLCFRHKLALVTATLMDMPDQAGMFTPDTRATQALLERVETCPRCRARTSRLARDPLQTHTERAVLNPTSGPGSAQDTHQPDFALLPPAGYVFGEQRPGARRTVGVGWVISGAVTLAVLVAAAAGTVWMLVHDDTSGQQQAGVEAFYADLKAGDCVRGEKDTRPKDLLLGQADVVACAKPHSAEVFARFSVPGKDYPGEEQVSAAAEDGCLQRFGEYVGQRVESSSLDVYWNYPTDDTWGQEHDVVCTVPTIAATQTGTVRGSGDLWSDVLALEVGECARDLEPSTDVWTYWRKTPCSRGHDYEVFARFTLPEQPWPGETELESMAHDGCERRFSRYVGVPLLDSLLDYEVDWPVKETWPQDRLVVCLLLADPQIPGSKRNSRQ